MSRTPDQFTGRFDLTTDEMEKDLGMFTTADYYRPSSVPPPGWYWTGVSWVLVEAREEKR